MKFLWDKGDRTKTEVQIFRRELYTHIYLDYVILEFLFCIKIKLRQILKYEIK